MADDPVLPSMTTTAAPWTGQQGWHVANWGWWGWAETVAKLAAIVVGLAAAIGGGGAVAVPDDHRIAFWALTAVAVGYTVAIYDRFIDREIFAMGFIVAVVVAHWAMVYAMGRDVWPGTAVRWFAALMLAGDLIKIGFFATTRTSVRSIPWPVPVAMTSTLALLYLVVLVAG